VRFGIGGHILPTGTVTLLFTDIEGSTALWEQMPTLMKSAVEKHHAILRETIEKNHGEVFQILGDAFQAAFALALDGLYAAIQAQRELQDADWGESGPLRVRMGLHTGPLELSPIPSSSGVREYAVCHTLNRAARVMSAGYGGQILVSNETKILIERELPEGVSLRNLGEHQLKGMRRLEHLYQVLASGLISDFPALATDITHPHNLPVELTSFVGREKEIDELKKKLNEPNTHLITITGPGGIGKTRLSLRIAEEMLEVYQDGVWLVELASLTDPVFLPQAIAQALHVREMPGQPMIKVLQEYLWKKRLLLVLDNCEHIKPMVLELVGDLLPYCPQLQIIATSREVLGLQGEIVFRCPSLLSRRLSIFTPKSSPRAYKELASEQAVRLFVERAYVAYSGFKLTSKNIATVDDICTKLEGLPLAIELAAARVRVLSVEQIAKRLDDVFHLLTGGVASKVPHHQTMKALIDWSYNLLTPLEKTIFLRLSVFISGWDLEAAEAIVCGNGIEKHQLVDLLAQLLDKSLIMMETLECGENRYRMLEIIRHYANEKFYETVDHQAVYQKHLIYFSTLAEQAAPNLWEKDQEQWIERLSRENDNLRSALYWALKRDTATEEEVEAGARITTDLWNFWYSFGVVKETISWLELALLRSPQPNQIRARLLAALGTFEWQLGHLVEAAERLQESLDLFKSLRDRHGLAEATHMYGHIVFDQQNYAMAERIFSDSLSIYESLNNTGVRVALIGDLGLVACHQGNLRLAREYYEKCMTLSIQNGLRDNEAQSYLRIGDVFRLEGNYEKADEYYQKSLTINREIKFSREIASSLHKLGFIALYQGNIYQAQALFLESLAIQEEVSNQQGIAECLAGLASVKVNGGEDEVAAVYFGAANKILELTGLPLAPADLAEWARDEKVLRSKTNSENLERAWAKGYDASTEDLVAGILSPA
jgi:predicted ATPase/class 3 adenylate cyclase